MPPRSACASVLKVWKELPRYWVTLLRSSAIGCWLGITPGGAIAASFMGYNLAKRFSKDPASFGKGRIEGVFAPETAAHASGTAALLPMLALGIPGSGTAAILLGGLMVWGLNPGPLLFVEHKDFVWGLIASMYLGNVVGLVIVLTTVPIFASILRVPFAAVAPMIVVSCAIGAYAIQNAMFDVWLMLLFGVVGYVFKKIGIPLAPFTLALVLGNRSEDAFRLSMIGAGGDMRVFWSNGLVGSITTLAFDPAVLAADRASCSTSAGRLLRPGQDLTSNRWTRRSIVSARRRHRDGRAQPPREAQRADAGRCGSDLGAGDRRAVRRRRRFAASSCAAPARSAFSPGNDIGEFATERANKAQAIDYGTAMHATAAGARRVPPSAGRADPRHLRRRRTRDRRAVRPAHLRRVEPLRRADQEPRPRDGVSRRWRRSCASSAPPSRSKSCSRAASSTPPRRRRRAS